MYFTSRRAKDNLGSDRIFFSVFFFQAGMMCTEILIHFTCRIWLFTLWLHSNLKRERTSGIKGTGL